MIFCHSPFNSRQREEDIVPLEHVEVRVVTELHMMELTMKELPITELPIELPMTELPMT